MREEYKDREYEVVAYNPEWPITFHVLEADIKEVFGPDAISVEHVGSTAVPSLAGKPTIDVLMLVNDIESVARHVPEMQEKNYTYAGDYISPDSRLFRKVNGQTVLANIRIFPRNHPHVREMLTVRNYLRAHSEEVVAYSNLKQELFAKYPNDYAAYRKEKDAYFDALNERALGG